MRGRRLVLVVAVIAALAIGQALTRAVATSNEALSEPFVESGRVGDDVFLTYADVQVTDVRPAAYFSTGVSTDLARRAAGVFVLVSVKGSATRAPLTLGSAWLVDPAERIYLPSTRADCTSAAHLDTGIDAYYLYCFEVPSDRLAHLHARFARGDLLDGRTAGDDLADVDLGISATEATRWATTKASYVMPRTGYAPFTLSRITLNETGS